MRLNALAGRLMGIDLSYVLIPVMVWLVAGIIKFILSSIKAKELVVGLIGYGGFASNHSATVSGMAALIALKEGI